MAEKMPKGDAKDYFLRNYWFETYGEMSDETGWSKSTLQSWKREFDLPKKNERNRIEYTHGVGMESVLYHLHHDAKMSTPEMAEALDVHRPQIKKWFEDTGVKKRGRSEAEQLKWEKYSPDERHKRVEEMSSEFLEQAERDGVPDGLKEWWKENTEKRQEFGAHGADAREENGMAGATGQDNPNWRGGKSKYLALRKQLGDRSWNYLQDHERNGECYNCGEGGEQLDLHHIIPILSGGTNESWNFMTLCSSCHRKAEIFIRQYPEFDPVLLE